MATIYDIARYTKLSPSTVGRVLRKSGYVSERTKTLVEEAARELNYTPTLAAQTLRTKKTKKILFCIEGMNNQFFNRLSEGINAVLEPHGYYCMICFTGASTERELEVMHLLDEQYADGMIMVSTDVCRPLLDAINKQMKPVVLINWVDHKLPTDRFYNVYTDVTRGTYRATELLINHGHQCIGYLSGGISNSTGLSRWLGYRQCLEDHQLPLNEAHVFQCSHRESIQDMADRFIQLDPRPTALVSTNDILTLQAIFAMKKRGVRIPMDVSVISSDDIDFCQYNDPPITSVALQDRRLGKIAAQLIMDHLAGKQGDYQTIVLDTEIKYRESVSAVR